MITFVHVELEPIVNYISRMKVICSLGSSHWGSSGIRYISFSRKEWENQGGE